MLVPQIGFDLPRDDPFAGKFTQSARDLAFCSSSSDTGRELSQAIVPVTPPEIDAHAVETAARVASCLVCPDAVAQFVRPSYCMQAFIFTCARLSVDQTITPKTPIPKTMPSTTGFFTRRPFRFDW
jgi:hypothetical protein